MVVIVFNAALGPEQRCATSWQKRLAGLAYEIVLSNQSAKVGHLLLAALSRCRQRRCCWRALHQLHRCERHTVP